MLSSHFVSLRKQVQQVEQDNDERSSIPITIRFVIYLSLCSLLGLTMKTQTIGGYHPDLRVACEAHAVASGPEPPR